MNINDKRKNHQRYNRIYRARHPERARYQRDKSSAKRFISRLGKPKDIEMMNHLMQIRLKQIHNKE